MSLEDVRYAFDDVVVLDGVNFEVAPGETVALVGSTGSGKSTLVSLLARLADPDAGMIRLGGIAIDHVEPDEVRRAVSIVFQESYLFADSVRHNVVLGADVSDERVDEVARLARSGSCPGCPTVGTPSSASGA